MDMIRLNSELEEFPTIFFDDLFNDLCEPIMNGSNEHFASSFWTPNEMIDH